MIRWGAVALFLAFSIPFALLSAYVIPAEWQYFFGVFAGLFLASFKVYERAPR